MPKPYGDMRNNYPYSVLLLYPDSEASNYGQETYYTFVVARDARAAVRAAVRTCMKDNGWTRARIPDPEGAFYPLLIIRGHHVDLSDPGALR